MCYRNVIAKAVAMRKESIMVVIINIAGMFPKDMWGREGRQ